VEGRTRHAAASPRLRRPVLGGPPIAFSWISSLASVASDRHWSPVKIVRYAVAVAVDGTLLGVGGAVAVRVGIEVIWRAIAVGVGGALLGIGDTVAVVVEVDGVRNPIAVRVGIRRRRCRNRTAPTGGWRRAGRLG